MRKYYSTPPVLDNHTVLLHHLSAKINSINAHNTEEIHDKLDKENDSLLLELLQDDRKLDKYINGENSGRCGSPLWQESIGRDLFNAVAEYDSELCAQITGMLLELDLASIKKLLSDATALETAVTQAKEEYLREKYPSVLPSRDELGEELHHYVAQEYKQNADKITGMILETGLRNVQQLLDHPQKLQKYINEAKDAIIDAGQWIQESKDY